VPVEHDHFAIEIGEGAEAEIAVFQDGPTSTSRSYTPATSAPEVETRNSVCSETPRYCDNAAVTTDDAV
jgi:hypothetical protein